MRLKVVAALVLSLSAFSANAEFYDGNKLMEWFAARDRIAQNRIQNTDYQESAYVHGYVVAIADSFQGVTLCFPENATAKQLLAVVQKHMNSNPEKWNFPASTLVYEALIKAYPCSRK